MKPSEEQKEQLRADQNLKHPPRLPDEGMSFLKEEKQAFIMKTERAVLGQLFLESEAIYDVIKDLTVDTFFYPNHRVILEAIFELFNKNTKIDLLTVVNHLRTTGKLPESGGVSSISSMTDNVGSTANLTKHVRMLQQFALERKLYEITCRTMSKLLKGEDDIFDILSEARQKQDESLKRISSSKIRKVGDIHKESIQKNMDVLITGQSSGVPTGMRTVDNLTNGWQKSDLIIIAGRPAMGKTAVVISMTIHPAIQLNIPLGIFSLEMSEDQIVGRLQSILSKQNVSRIVKKQLNAQELSDLKDKANDLNNAPIYIDDSAGLSVADFKAKAREMVRDHGVELIIIDYLQLMKAGGKFPNREQEIAEISRNLKIIAKELDIPIIALSQLSRSVEQRGGDKKPILSDLRESGQIEQDADMICFCYRPEYYGLTEYEVEGNIVSTDGLFILIVAKHRNGGIGDLVLQFDHKYTYVHNHPMFTPISNLESGQSQLPPPPSNSFQPNTSFESPAFATMKPDFSDLEEDFKKDEEEDTPF